MKFEAKQIYFFSFIFIGLKIFSYIFTPPTPLLAAHPLNSALSIFILATAAFLILHKDKRGWIIVAAEILLGGSGGYLSVGPIALRTALLFTSLLIYFGLKLSDGKLLHTLKANKNFTLAALFVVIWAVTAAAIGIGSKHSFGLVFSDFIPYLFIFYFFPLYELISDSHFIKSLGSMAVVFVLGNALFSLLTLIGFSSGAFILQDSYYHWFRDVALGKITDFQDGFYRITLNEHLLLAPAILCLIYKNIIEKINKFSVLLLLSLLFILSLNLTRIYFLALFIACLLLIRKKYLNRAIKTLLVTGFLFLTIFSLTHLSATRFKSLGFELLGLRISSIASPQIEESSLSRMLLLPEILNKIVGSPIVGTGLGDSVSVFSPVYNEQITTPHFDWGYLEILAETGSIGALLWIVLLVVVFYRIKKSGLDKPLLISLFAALLIINITSPALFHVFGILLLIYLATGGARAFDKQSGEKLHNSSLLLS